MYILLGFSDELEAQNLINKYHELNMCSFFLPLNLIIKVGNIIYFILEDFNIDLI